MVPDYYELLEEKVDFEADNAIFLPRHNVHRVQEQIIHDRIPLSPCYLCYNMKQRQLPNWQERAAFGWSTAGNDIVATIFICLFFFPFFFSPPSQPFLIEGVPGSKNVFTESC